MTGVSEILVLVLLIACVLILPRLFKPQSAQKDSNSSPLKKISALTVKARASIFLTLLYPCGAALFLKPWRSENLTLFLAAGVLPVILVWSAVWILRGRKPK